MEPNLYGTEAERDNRMELQKCDNAGKMEVNEVSIGSQSIRIEEGDDKLGRIELKRTEVR